MAKLFLFLIFLSPLVLSANTIESLEKGAEELQKGQEAKAQKKADDFQIRLDNQNARQKVRRQKDKMNTLSQVAAQVATPMIALGVNMAMQGGNLIQQGHSLVPSRPEQGYAMINQGEGTRMKGILLTTIGVGIFGAGLNLGLKAAKMQEVENILDGNTKVNAPTPGETRVIPDLGSPGLGSPLQAACTDSSCSEICKAPFCKFGSDKEGNPQLELDTDKNGSTDEIISSSDIKNLDPQHPMVKPLIKQAQENYQRKLAAALKKEGKEENEEEDLEEEEDWEGVDESFSLIQGNHSSSSKPRPFSYKNHLKGLMSEFVKKKNQAATKNPSSKARKVGSYNDNIFLMVHRRYQERRKNKEFMEASL